MREGSKSEKGSVWFCGACGAGNFDTKHWVRIVSMTHRFERTNRYHKMRMVGCGKEGRRNLFELRKAWRVKHHCRPGPLSQMVDRLTKQEINELRKQVDRDANRAVFGLLGAGLLKKGKVHGK